MAWDLKGEQLVTLTDILHHEKYNVTGLKNYTQKASEDVCKSLEEYLVVANTTHEEEGITIKTYKDFHDTKLDWWENQPCDCNWSMWKSWSSCTKTCGEGSNAGTRCREREVTQAAINGGRCLGPANECEKCNEKCCRKINDFSSIFVLLTLKRLDTFSVCVIIL